MINAELGAGFRMSDCETCFASVSGSLLVACSQFGAYVCGADIDYNTIHGRGKLWLNPLLCTNQLSIGSFSIFL